MKTKCIQLELRVPIRHAASIAGAVFFGFACLVRADEPGVPDPGYYYQDGYSTTLRQAPPNPVDANSGQGSPAAQNDAAEQERNAVMEVQRRSFRKQAIARQKAADAAAAQIKFDAGKKVALSQLKGIDDADSDLDAFGSHSGSTLGLKGLDNAPSLPVTDSRVVDGRNVPSGLPKFVEDSIPRTEAGARVRKGFEAITQRDWKVALAWFQDALNHEPGNVELTRLVDLVQFTLQHQKQGDQPAGNTGENSESFKRVLQEYTQFAREKRSAVEALSVNSEWSIVDKWLNDPAFAPDEAPKRQ
jgi:hypothetical protein